MYIHFRNQLIFILLFVWGWGVGVRGVGYLQQTASELFVELCFEADQ